MRIYTGALTRRINQFSYLGRVVGASAVSGGPTLCYSYYDKYQKWSWRNNLCLIFSGIFLGVAFIQNKIAKRYVLALDKEVLKNLETGKPLLNSSKQLQFIYTAHFTHGETIKFESKNIFLPISPDLFCSLSLLHPETNKKRDIFINSEDMSYFDYKEMVLDAVKEKLPSEVVENWDQEKADDEFKVLLGEMEKLKAEEKKLKEEQRKRQEQEQDSSRS